MFGLFNRTGCRIGGKCSGCEWIRIGRSEQIKKKEEKLRFSWHSQNLPELPNDITIADVGDKGLRNVVDISFRRRGRRTTMGFFDISREKVLNAAPCPALSEDLQEFLVALDCNPPPLSKASLRLRVNQHGQRGIWIDAANIEIRSLLNEKTWLQSIMEDAHVEMGQKRKYVTAEIDELRLDKPILRPWFSTPMPKRRKDAPLWTVVGGFTQPSIKANRNLVHRALTIAQSTNAKRWLEFGSGCGNFTLPFGDQFDFVSATEIFPLAKEGLTKAIAQHRLNSKIEVLAVNLQRNTEMARNIINEHDALLVDPPRSGLHHSLNTLAEAQKQPKVILYVSCHAESLSKDAHALYELGYKLEIIEGIDQFPNTPHCEWIACFQKTV
jgi:23S rRNA (uracil1939-C5)-methyltransferase